MIQQRNKHILGDVGCRFGRTGHAPCETVDGVVVLYEDGFEFCVSHSSIVTLKRRKDTGHQENAIATPVPEQKVLGLVDNANRVDDLLFGSDQDLRSPLLRPEKTHCETEVPNSFPQVIRVRKHVFRADLSESAGSTDSAPGVSAMSIMMSKRVSRLVALA